MTVPGAAGLEAGEELGRPRAFSPNGVSGARPGMTITPEPRSRNCGSTA